MKKPLLCMLGFHKWGRATFLSETGSNVRDYKKKCERCGKVKTWVEAAP